MKINQLIPEYSELLIQKIEYFDGCAYLEFLNYEETTKYLLCVETKFLFIDFPKDKNDVYRVCNVNLSTLPEVLNINNNIYVPSESFGQFMNESRNGFNLAYGLSTKIFKYLLFVKGQSLIFSCVLEDTKKLTLKTMLLNNNHE